ncbi:hypothetical protein [Roseicyclus sp.]|uniref:hypothetical protein n=1 Tax=Roseicyclus sp. TaxID=1914329 RepID=UPI003F9EC270
MTHEHDHPLRRTTRVGFSDPFHRLVEDAYRHLERPAPRHVPGCGCALCADRARARMLAGRAARDWTHDDVSAWLERAAGVARDGAGRGGAAVVSRTDRAVFRFLLPRVIEILASGAAASQDGTLARAFALFAPLGPDGWSARDWALLERFAGLLVDRAVHDPDWPHDVIATLHLLSAGGWPLGALLRQALSDPDLPAALARLWGRTGRTDALFPGTWPVGAVKALCDAFVTPLMAERLMNYAMAEGTSGEETDRAMRTADLILRAI